MKTTSKISLALGAALLLAGCNAALKSDTGVNVAPDGSVQVQNDQGTYTAGKNEVPADWPTDVPTYPGSTVEYSATANPTDGKQAHAMTLSTTDTATAVADFYKKELASKGWKIEGTMAQGDMTFLGATKDALALSIAVSTQDGKTMVTLGVENQK